MNHGHKTLAGALVTVVLAVALALLAAGGQGALAADVIIHVDADAPGTNDGTSWEDAFLDLQDALATACDGDQIWVAAGTYRPTGGSDRYASFQMKNYVAIYGGFDPDMGDTEWEDRDPESNLTILSGDIGVPGNSSDNSYHVFYHPWGLNLNYSAILDGFTITRGNADLSGVPEHTRGGGMLNEGSSPKLSNVIFAENEAGVRGGGMYNGPESAPALADCTFVGNWSAYYGGGMYNDNAWPTLNNVEFSLNQAGLYGGGIYNYEASPELTDCVFLDNAAEQGGGGMISFSSSLALTGCTFIQNSARFGGGMHNEDSSLEMELCTFSENTAWVSGGGMYNYGSSMTLTGSTFEFNTAEEDGGGMVNESCPSMEMTNCVFYDNACGNSGGGIYNRLSTPDLVDSAFTDNSADLRGGGMFNTESSPVLTNVTFSGNQSEEGAGMHNSDGSSPVLSGCTFSGNSARAGGGGMYNYISSSPVLSDCSFLGNSGGAGAGMVNINSAPALTNCIFDGNLVSVGSGGAMWNSGSAPTIVNCTFSNNSASVGGVMTNTFYSAPTITNCTFWGNTATYADGGAILNHGFSAPVVTNCILWGNTPDQISKEPGSSPVVTYSDVEGNYPGMGNIDEDPLFVDAANGDFHLGEGSRCIDEGNNTAPSVPLIDFEGDLRPLDGDGDGSAVVDMGVDEAPGEYIPVPLEVEIDITPNTPNNIIKLSSPRLVAVGILTTEEFDPVSEVPYASVVFAGAPAVEFEVVDINGDEDNDLLLFFYPAEMDELTLKSKEATLTGVTHDGTEIEGTDRVKVKE